MVIESKWERNKRIKSQKRANKATLIIAIALVVVISAAVFCGKSSLAAKNADYETQKAQLEEQIKEQEERRDELEEYGKYVQTKKFYEETAKNKFGLIYPDEILVKPSE
jgi:cell division protein FtsB